MAEHLIHANNWFSKYDIDRAEQIHYSVFKPTVINSSETLGNKTQTATTHQVEPISTKPKEIAKSIIVIDVKPWDDETDINAIEEAVRSIEADGLLWGQSKQILIGYGIKNLQIGCVVEDDKIGMDFLEEKICEFDEYVQSVDLVRITKL